MDAQNGVSYDPRNPPRANDHIEDHMNNLGYFDKVQVRRCYHDLGYEKALYLAIQLNSALEKEVIKVK